MRKKLKSTTVGCIWFSCVPMAAMALSWLVFISCGARRGSSGGEPGMSVNAVLVNAELSTEANSEAAARVR